MSSGLGRAPRRQWPLARWLFAAVVALAACACATYVPFARSGSDSVRVDRDDTLFFQVVDAVPEGRTNAEGSLAWSESYLLQALIDMYDATEDGAWLRIFARRFEAVLAVRDDEPGVKDAYRGRIMPAWGSSAYTEGANVAWLCHAFMLYLPATRFASRVERDDIGEYRGLSDRIRRSVRETLDAFEDDWSESDGWYLFPEADPNRKAFRLLPMNMCAIVGTTLAEMSDSTSDPVLDAKARAMAKVVKRVFAFTLDGCATWPYFPWWWDRVDDIAHGSLTAEFVSACAARGLEFDETFMKAMRNTFFRRIVLPDGGMSENLAGFGRSSPLMAFRWVSVFKGSEREGEWADYAHDVLVRHEGEKKSIWWACLYASWRAAETRLARGAAK